MSTVIKICVIVAIIVALAFILASGVLNSFIQPAPENGIWVLPQDVDNVDFTELNANGIDNIYLHCSAVDEMDEKELTEWITKAKYNGIKVHIWVPVFQDDGQWVLPEDENGTVNQSFMDEKLEDISRYSKINGISGIELDYMRFPGGALNYSNANEPINDFAQKAHDVVKKNNPSLIFSITIMPEPYLTLFNSYNDYGQDYHKLSSIADVVIVMMYKGNYNQNSDWIKETTEWYIKESKGAHVVIGLQGYVSDNNLSYLSTDELTGDVQSAFDGGANSVALFRYGLTNIINITALQ